MDGYYVFTRDLGRRLKARRKEKGLSQRRLAEAIGMTQNAVANYEHAWTCMSAWTLLKVCEVLDVSADEMLGLEEE